MPGSIDCDGVGRGEKASIQVAVEQAGGIVRRRYVKARAPRLRTILARKIPELAFEISENTLHLRPSLLDGFGVPRIDAVEVVRRKHGLDVGDVPHQLTVDRRVTHRRINRRFDR